MPKKVGKFVKLFAKNMKAGKGPARYAVSGLQVTCTHCRNETFQHGEAQLNTALLSFFALDFANRSANILICNHCGFVHWFFNSITRIDS